MSMASGYTQQAREVSGGTKQVTGYIGAYVYLPSVWSYSEFREISKHQSGPAVCLQRGRTNKNYVRNCSEFEYHATFLFSEMRRLSPVAVMANVTGGNYLDLINGPQDHGWCDGYTCQERLSTFHAIVAHGKRNRRRYPLTLTDQHLKVVHKNLDHKNARSSMVLW